MQDLFNGGGQGSQLWCSSTIILVCLTSHQKKVLLLCLDLDRCDHNQLFLKDTAVRQPDIAAHIGIYAQAPNKRSIPCIAKSNPQTRTAEGQALCCLSVPASATLN